MVGIYRDVCQRGTYPTWYAINLLAFFADTQCRLCAQVRCCVWDSTRDLQLCRVCACSSSAQDIPPCNLGGQLLACARSKEIVSMSVFLMLVFQSNTMLRVRCCLGDLRPIVGTLAVARLYVRV
jgi:hypothetical protein